MKFVKTIAFALCFTPFVAFAAGDFSSAAQLLSAARAGNARQVQVLVANGANVNFIDATGLSLVCTALMNNDLTAVQILQAYGADSSGCDVQIKNYKTKNAAPKTGGLFGGLSTTQGMILTAGAAAAAVGGVVLLSDAFGPSNNNNTPGGSSGGGGGSGGGSSSGGGSAWNIGALPYGPSLMTAEQETANYATNLASYSPSDTDSILYKNFQLMNANQNYLLLMRGYSPLARGYLGMRTLRNSENKPLSLAGAEWGELPVGGGRPVNVALITANGINAAENTSLENKYFVWAGVNSDWTVSAASNETYANKYYNNNLTVNNTDDFSVEEDTSFDLSGNGTAIHNTDATDADNMLAKIVGGADAGYTNADFFGFMPNGQMTIYRTGGAGAYYKNYTALLNGANRILDLAAGRSRVDVIANLDVIEPLHETNAKTINDVLSVAPTDYKQTFSGFIADAYGASDVNDLPATNASLLFNSLGSSFTPLTVFSTGASKTDSSYSGAYQTATFENAVPLVYNNANHLFMSVVSVGASTVGGTIVANSDGNPNKYQLAQWQDADGTGEYYKARVCGIAGKGGANIDPWCFAAVGVTDEMAAAAAAGAAGVLRSAFYYMTPQQIFTLLALTADGPFLTRTTGGTKLTTETLISHLQGMYEMPYEYQARINAGENYLDVFKEVFGYGVINLERATTPGTNLYFYTDNKIVATNGNAYWRAATNTNVRSSSALNLGGVSVSTAAYDVLESADASISLPRVWENNFTFGDTDKHGLYMGDVLGDLQTRAATDDALRYGKMSFSLTRGTREYNDGMGGVQTIRLGYSDENLDIDVGYQHYLTDGESRFYGMSNPVLNLASNAISTGANYKFGNWSVGARAFSGAITDEGLLESDPTVSAKFEPMRLGAVSGTEANFGWQNNRFGFVASAGVMHENNTILGAYTTGLMAIDSTDTGYLDIDAFWRPTDKVRLRARATFAHSAVNSPFDAAMSISSLNSDALAFGADIENLSFGVSLPLAVRTGDLRYAYANYDIIENSAGRYDLVISGADTRHIDIAPKSREVRLNAVYRHNLGAFTDGAFGLVYRVHPNNMTRFGNEALLMLKLTHTLGI